LILESCGWSHFLHIFQEISFLMNVFKIDSQGASYDPNKAIGKMSWFLDRGLDLQIPILSCFFLNIDNFWTIDCRKSRLVSFSLYFPGDFISHNVFIIDSQGASYDSNKAIGKMSWFSDRGLDLQIPILSCFFLKVDNFWTVDRRKSRLASFF
jgi:hypothetical protein